jgi:branched-chain amino acid transport system substrate-binding protein
MHHHYRILMHVMKSILFLLLIESYDVWSSNVGLPIIEPSIKIACLFPMSGPSANYGEDSVEAIRIAEEELKKRQDQHRYKNEGDTQAFAFPTVEVLIGDTKSKPLRAVQLARSFIDNEKVNFLCGGVSSSVALAVTKVAYDKKVIFVGTDHASPRLVDEALHPYYFRMNNGTRQSMQAGAKYIAQHYRKRAPLKIAFIGPDYDYGYRAWDDLLYFLKNNNISVEIAAELWPKLNEKDFTIYIDALVNAKPDIIVNGHWGTDFVNFIRQAKNTSLFEKAKLMNFDAGGNYDTLAALGNDMPLGLVLSARHHVNWPQTVENQQFVKKFYQRTGRYPSYAAAGAYAGIHAIAAVVSKTKSLANNGELISRFQELSIKLPEDPDGFESHMNPVTHQIQQVQAIGITVRNTSFPPATVLLDHWFVYSPD